MRRSFDQVDLQNAAGKRIGTFTAPLQVDGGADGLVLRARRRYRGILELRPGAFGISTINAVGLDDYVRGVVAAESPSSWPLEALKAQAVAARTYAITTTKGGDRLRPVRRHALAGLRRHRLRDAVRPTRPWPRPPGQVVTYQGPPVVTYFFSTSGGRTENVENVFGGAAQPWLRSVDDPYDNVSPRHRWRLAMTLASAQARLGGLVKGRFRGIKVVKRGASPRVLQADVVGTRGKTRVSGATLRARFGLYDTWASYTSIATRKAEAARRRPGRHAAAARGRRRHRWCQRGRRPHDPLPRDRLAARAPCCRRATATPSKIQIRRDGRWREVLTTPDPQGRLPRDRHPARRVPRGLPRRRGRHGPRHRLTPAG